MTPPRDPRAAAWAYWLCAAGALWLLLSPAAFERRAGLRARDRLTAAKLQAWRSNLALERYAAALRSGDPAAVELEARRLGYARPGETFLPLDNARIAAELARLEAERREYPLAELARDICHAILPTLLVAALCGLALIFFADLRIVEPAVSDPSSLAQTPRSHG